MVIIILDANMNGSYEIEFVCTGDSYCINLRIHNEIQLELILFLKLMQTNNLACNVIM